MAVHTYIGARYVPRFVGTYDPTQIYEALDVVDNGVGTSYIARDVVPAGTPLTDTTHWFVYGASSGAIVQLQNDMQQAQNDIIGLGNDITAIESDIDELETKLSVNKRVVVISDSYGLVRGGNTPWVDFFGTYLNLGAGDYFHYSEGSMGFNRTGDNGHIAETLLQSHAGDITDHDSISDVVFGLGVNDLYGTLATLDAALDSCIAYTRSTYPNANIHIAFIGNLATKSAATYVDYATVISKYSSACGRNNVAYVEGCEYVMHNIELLQADGIHPTTDGCKSIAGYIAAYLAGGASYSISRTCSVTAANFGSASNIRQTIDNGVVSLNLFLDNTTAAVTLTRNVATNIGSITNPIIKGIGGVVHYTPIVLYDGTDYRLALWYIYNGNVYLMSKQGGATVTIPSGSSCTPLAATYPTLEA